ncbi:MAG: response regulator [Chloroflexota bacterium]|nr:response regulator [Chloroflexota bacterium]
MTRETIEKIKVLIIDDIAETRENLRKLLSFETGLEVVGAAAGGAEGVELAQQLEPHVVLMDINMPDMDGITATEKLLQEVPTAQVVMLSVQGETDYLRRAMLAGARDYLTKPASGDELVNTIHRVFEMGKTQSSRRKVTRPDAPEGKAAAKKQSRRAGELVAVFAPKGGVGGTTIAVNTAVALQQMTEDDRKVALMDAHLQFGDVGVMLNLRPNRSIADLAQRIDELDRDLLSGVMTAHGSGIKVLLAPPRPEAAESLLAVQNEEEGVTALEAILGAMREDFDFVVADLWSWVDDVSLTLLDAATLIVLVVTPDIPAIKSARLFLELAGKLDYPQDKILLVVSGADRRGSLRAKQIEQAMMPVAVEIPYDDRAALAAANRGVPLVVQDRDRPISQSLLELAEVIYDRLSATEEPAAEDEERETEGVGGTNLFRLKRAFSRG